ncbi:MAG: glycosyltransferase family 39 protein [Sedimentisphaerales bacterium]|nr:glycosyltransferase family 39 protein [Sedimentisphaerales bacterium]
MYSDGISELNNYKVRSRVILVLVLMAAAAAFSYLFISARNNPDIPFLSSDTDAKWIQYPLAVSLKARGANYVNLTTEFTRDFELTAVPSKVSLCIKGFKRYRLWINEHRLFEDLSKQRNWKKVRIWEVSGFLREGTNTVRVEIDNGYGPPVLWLYSRGLEENIRTDTSWNVSMLGSEPVKASLADDSFVYSVNLPDMRPIDALCGKMPIIVLFFLISCAFFWLGNYEQNGVKPNLCKVLYTLMSSPKYIMMICIALWIIAILNNAPKMPIDVAGFDYKGHIHYVKYLLSNKSVPLANEGWVAYHPPLFYFISAVMISLGRLFSDQEFNAGLLRIVPFLCGIGQIYLAYLASRIIFPDNKTRQNISIVIAALIPMNFYIASYLSNESLSALLMSLVILITVIMLNSRQSLLKTYCLLGMVIGLAFLTKFTILTILPAVFFLLFYKMLVEEKCSIVKIGTNFSFMLLLIFVIAGWFYIRNWQTFGKIFVTNWDCMLMSEKLGWWQDPGFHTYKYFFRFGRVFAAPYFAGTYSFFDSLYSTFWGDSFFGGRTLYTHRPPWNYEYTSIVYILSIPAFLMIVIGTVCAVRKAIFKVNKTWLLMLGSIFVLLCSIIYMNLQLAHYSAAKAFYALGVILPICLLFSLGFDCVNGRLKSKKLFLLQVIFYGWFGSLILTVFLSLFICREGVYETPDVFEFAQQGRVPEAVAYYEHLAGKTPDCWEAHHELAKAYTFQRRYDEAIEHYEKALEIKPDAYDVLNNIARALIDKPNSTLADKKEAVKYAQQSCRLTGYMDFQLVMTLVSAYEESEQSLKAMEAAERVIELAASAGKTNVVEKTQKWLKQYKMPLQFGSPATKDDTKP